MTDNSRTRILNTDQVTTKIQRIAFELLENNYKEKGLILLGVNGTGEILAGLLADILLSHHFNCTLGTIHIHKQNPLSQPVSYSIPVEQCTNASVIFVDDVANSGRTLFYAMEPLMHCALSSIRVAVLIDREHKQFPITADYVGLSLSTGLHEHILVEPVGNNLFEAYLQ